MGENERVREREREWVDLHEMPALSLLELCTRDLCTRMTVIPTYLRPNPGGKVRGVCAADIWLGGPVEIEGQRRVERVGAKALCEPLCDIVSAWDHSIIEMDVSPSRKHSSTPGVPAWGVLSMQLLSKGSDPTLKEGSLDLWFTSGVGD